MYSLKNILFRKYLYIIRKFCFECLSRFWLQPQGEGIYQKKLDVKTFLFSSSNRETQRCNGQKSRQSKLLSLVQKQPQKYNIRDSYLVFFKYVVFIGWKFFESSFLRNQLFSKCSSSMYNENLIENSCTPQNFNDHLIKKWRSIAPDLCNVV